VEIVFGDLRVPDRLWGQLEEDVETGCWIWFGKETPQGWPVYSRRAVWRLLYERLVGPIPPEVSMTCGSDPKSCGNPYHRLSPHGGRTAPHTCPLCAKPHDPDHVLGD